MQHKKNSSSSAAELSRKLPAGSLVSVIMPAYNAEKYIAEAIDSIIAQTYKNWELIIINDCSTDSTADIVESYAKKDRRIKVIHATGKLYEYGGRNLGIERAKGDYIAWLDADDMSAPNRLQKQMDFLAKNKRADMVGTMVKTIDGQGKTMMNKEIKNLNKWFARDHHLNNRGLDPAYVGSSFLFKKSILQEISKPYFRPIAVGLDLDFLFRLMEKNLQVFNLPDKLYHYRTHGAQITNDKFAMRLLSALVRYGAQCRRGGWPDPLTPMIKKHGVINKKTMVPIFATILRDKKFPGLGGLIHEVIYVFFLNRTYFIVALIMLIYRPILFIWTMARITLAPFYNAVPIIHRPWHRLKAIVRRK